MKGSQAKDNTPISDEVTPEPIELAKDFPVPSFEDWKALAIGDLKGADYDRKLRWQTLEGITVEPIYTAGDLEGLPHVGGLPGFAPFERGTAPLHGVSPRWQIRQDCLLPAPEDVNSALRDGIARGCDAVSMRLDNAARQGLDGDDPEAVSLAGSGGCTISSINGLRIALADIDLAKYPVTIRTGGAALPVLGMLIALAEERGIDRRVLVGSVECDPHRKLLRRGTMQGPVDVHFREMADMASFCQAQCPGIRPVIVNSHSWHNSGASAVQELGYTLASGVEYARELTSRGLTPDGAFFSMLFSFSISTNLYMEVAKLRAARILWAKVAKAFGVENEHAGKMFLHARTSTFTKCVDDPYNNMVRTSLESFAAAVGGVDSMYVAPFDEVLGRPDAFSMRIARNQQILLQEEVALARVVDPLGGSYVIESLTDSIAREAWKVLQEVEAEGGLIAALRKGSPQKAVGVTAAKRREMIESRRQPIIGSSNYANPMERRQGKPPIAREKFVMERRKRLERLKRMRRNSEVRRYLDQIREAAQTGQGNVAEIAVDAAREGATIAEILHAAVRDVDGERIAVTPLRTWRASSPWEELREASRNFTARTGDAPVIGLVLTGPAGMRLARADFSRGFLAGGGFTTVDIGPVESATEAAVALERAGVLAAVVCSDDPTYSDFVPALIDSVKALSLRIPVYVAGNPADSRDMLKAAGTAGFIHLKANAHHVLSEMQSRLGVHS